MMLENLNVTIKSNPKHKAIVAFIFAIIRQ
jgi:hypothetical protein